MNHPFADQLLAETMKFNLQTNHDQSNYNLTNLTKNTHNHKNITKLLQPVEYSDILFP